MSWLLWRQHRTQALITAIGIALFAVAVAVTGIHMAHEYDNAVSSCSAGNGCHVVGQLFRGYGAIIDTVHLTIALPLILGLFFGVVLIAREVEQSTNVLVWTQTVTRRRWLFSKVALALGATLIISLAVSALVTWWSGTPNSLNGNRFEGAQFDTQNLVPVAHALFAVALGIAAGALLRRTLPALAATVGSSPPCASSCRCTSAPTTGPPSPKHSRSVVMATFRRAHGRSPEPCSIPVRRR